MTAVQDLLARFEHPHRTYGPVPIWWWSGARLDNARLRWQMEQLTAQGVHQAVVMCLAPRGPIFGSVADDPEFMSEAWWEVFLAACVDARELGFSFWLYDQLGFSGANFQGQLVSATPEHAGWDLQRLQADAPATLQCPAGSTPVAGYVVLADAGPDDVPVPVPVVDGSVTWDGPAGRVVLVHAVRSGFDYFSPAAGNALVDRVLGEFERRAAGFFGDVIVGLFQDELPSMPNWGGDFAASFAATHGYDLTERIGLLWEPGGHTGEAVRRDHHAHRALLARRAFFEPLAAWTRRTGVVAGFDQQSPAREGDPVGGVSIYGDYLQTHAGFTAPGSDHWGDSKVHSSLAHANGHPRVWLESFHSSGWGGTLEETYDWLAPFIRRGATLYDPHAVYYATVGGWWEWAPPSTCWRQPYWPTYLPFATAVTRLCSLLSLGELVADTVVLHPTVTSQAARTLDRTLPDAARASAVYHDLNGVTAWFSEAPGVLDRAGHDYEVFDDATIASGKVADGALVLAGGRFRNVVLPAAAVVDAELAVRLAELVEDGGRVVCVGAGVRHVLDGPDGSDGAAAAERWRAAVDSGRVHQVATAAEVPALLVGGDMVVEADAPVLVRRHEDALVLVLNGHDDRTGTRAPIIEGHRNLNWVEESFRWDRYWTALGTDGYEFRPIGDRRARVLVTGAAPGLRAQQWDPRSGARTELGVHRTAEGLELDVPFEDGSMSVVVLAPDLPPATRRAPGPVVSSVAVEGPWQLQAESTLDNRWADLGDPADRGVLPLQLWRLGHAVGEAPGHWDDVHATFGPYADVLPPQPDDALAGRLAADDPRWQPAEWSLSRGIRKDDLHFEYLGPKGMVPEEFLSWPTAGPGQWVAFRTHLPLPDGTGRHLVLGANARRRVFLDGAEVTDVAGAGYWSSTGLPDGAGVHALEVWLLGDDSLSTNPQDGPTSGIRADFAVVTDLDRYRRPEWLVPVDGSAAGSVVTVATSFTLDAVPAETVAQIATEGATEVWLNGTEIGRQGDFEPYGKMRQMRVHPYDLRPHLRAGENRLELRVTDPGRTVAALVDSLPRERAGLGLATDAGWTMTRDGAPVGVALRHEQWTDPRWVCLVARPHPLPRAAWLDPAAAGDGVVLDVVPQRTAGPGRTEWLRVGAPIGAVGLRVDTDLRFTATLDGTALDVGADGSIRFAAPLSHQDTVLLRFDDVRGHSGGALLRGPVTVDLAEAAAPLLDWQELGLRSLGGQVTYTREVELAAPRPGERVELDLGEVRGTAQVQVNGGAVHTLVWSPYRVDVTDDVLPGANRVTVVVRGTLAGHLDDVSPTPAIAAGQTRAGLFGPVAVRVRAATPATSARAD